MLCGPCKIQGKKVAAAVFCNECENELLCKQCGKRHSIQTISKTHVLQDVEKYPSTTSSDDDHEIYCDICRAMGEARVASAFCFECKNERLCVLCQEYHKIQKGTHMHKLQHISCYGKITEESLSNAVTTIKTDIVKETEYKPGRPTAISVSFESIKLQWSTPEAFKDGDNFQLSYRELNSTKWEILKNEKNDSLQTITNLTSETQYIFRVRVIHGDWEGPYSDVSESITTGKSAASNTVKCCTCISEVDIFPRQYELRMEQKARNPSAKIRALELGSQQHGSFAEKTIMLVGETGAGKSTMIDGMANYILGVAWEDPFRVKMVSLEDEEIVNAKNKAMSQTEWITSYTIHPIPGGRLKHAITLIDTPGFGDTRGMEKDKEIVKQIHKLFMSTTPEGVLQIDAICFLVRASDGRLNASQTYIFNSIMSLFGKDIEQNICTLITFADSNEPSVLAVLTASGLPFGQRFVFNNSALFANNTNEGDSRMTHAFWDMGFDNFRTFFRFVKFLPTKSLHLTKDVLFERSVLEITLVNFEPMIDACIIKVHELESEIKCLEKYQELIKVNANFQFKTKELRIKTIDLPEGEHVTNCKICQFTCHLLCKRGNNSNKKKCWAMDKNGYCRICPGKCFWEHHENTPKKLFHFEEEVVKTYDDIKAKYDQAKGEEINQERVLQNLKDELSAFFAEMEEMIDNVRTCNERLAEIALRPNALSVEQYIETMIEKIAKGQKPGYMEKIETLNQFKERALLSDKNQTFRRKAAATVLSELNEKKGQSNKLKSFFCNIFKNEK